MTDTVGLRLVIQPVGDATDTEVAEATAAVRDTLASRPEVATIAPATAPAAPGAKVVEAVTLGALVLAVAPAAVEGLLQIVRDLLARPGSYPTKVTVKAEGREVSVEFDPRTTTRDDIAALAATLAAGLKQP